MKTKAELLSVLKMSEEEQAEIARLKAENEKLKKAIEKALDLKYREDCGSILEQALKGDKE